MSTSARTVLTLMCAFFTVHGLVSWNPTTSGLGGGLGIALIALVVDEVLARKAGRR